MKPYETWTGVRHVFGLRRVLTESVESELHNHLERIIMLPRQSARVLYSFAETITTAKMFVRESTLIFCFPSRGFAEIRG